MKKVTIVIPVYNTEKYLSDCLASALVQTLKDIEILVINDGSPDNSDKIVQKFLSDDKRIIYIKQENQGVSAARNKGIELAQGEYIFFFDSDDIMAENFIEELYKTAKNENSDIVFTDKRNIGENTAEQVAAVITYGGFYRTEFLKSRPEIRFPSGIKYGEDGLFSHIALDATDKISRSFNSWYFYRLNGTQATNNLKHNPELALTSAHKQFEFLKNFYEKNNLFRTKSLHLARYIQAEVFYAAFYYMPRRHFNARRKFFYMILNFFNIYVRQNLTQEDFETLGYHFKRMLKCKSFIEFELKDILLSTPFIHKLFMKYKSFKRS